MARRSSLRLIATSCILISIAGSAACDSKQRGEEQTPAATDQSPTESTTQADTESTSEDPAAPEKSDLETFTSDIDGEGSLHAVIETSEGTIHCDLHEERAPLTVTNFVGLALGKKAWRNPETGEIERGKPYYDSVPFHRVIPNFMIQAGDRTGNGTQGPGYTIPDEFHPELRHDKAGVLSMANRGEPNTSGAQWFILEMPAPHLDERHSVFGQCGDLDVVSKIARVPTGPENRPQSPPTIDTINIVRTSEDSDKSAPSPEQNE